MVEQEYGADLEKCDRHSYYNCLLSHSMGRKIMDKMKVVTEGSYPPALEPGPHNDVVEVTNLPPPPVITCNKGVFDCTIKHHESIVNPVHSNLAPGQAVDKPTFADSLLDKLSSNVILIKKDIKTITGLVPTDVQVKQIKKKVMDGCNVNTAAHVVMGNDLTLPNALPLEEDTKTEFAKILDALPWEEQV
ncbi:hypothetical protein LCGC14_0264400 [marine sediment metagenome]|uniref:Uncharacterized protein n=1 Tax=marine sediment metagenome TaxID=412755 RepID=A0A0F9X5Q0_9ZZZZ